MHARAVAATTTALLATTCLLVAAPGARADDLGAPPTVVAHRGASAYAPENTLAAVDKAAELGIRWVENDVQRTKDGELVVIHDDNLKRTTDAEEVFPDRAPWKVKDFTAAEIARLDAGSWFGAAYAGARVPTLTQYLRRVERNRQQLLLEIKNPELYPGIEQQTLKVLANQGWLDRAHVESRLVVQSFSADSIRAVHDLKPAVKTGFLGTPAVADLPTYAAFTDQINPSYGTISAGYVAAVHAFTGAHGKAMEVFTWTVDDAANAQRVAGYGVDGIITNKPDVVRDAVSGD
ncbi:glycerophosphodiester phosphodiesterase [Streptomyces sp. XM83C]|jgi:glycerophosphoryl diester phosphodiesterase|uniref:Glycerophosphodiester phosphodiesterase n=1 Tax=Streptomyces thermocoprophilus TaxID=78356 RepID=A0ABV5VKT1_9ACTN|nr:glycerophosphodiester phosphodiesterase family protein [Streptomyces sp. XM83C]MCK1821819.1 glycerophosphodiester phosphodiesterase [Streptomyces sp. XM83C]